MAEGTFVALDVGSTKVVVLIAQVGEGGRVKILGVGIEPSHGMHRGSVVDVNKAAGAIKAAKAQAERTSGYEIGRTFVSVASKHISSLNSRGVTGLNPNKGVVNRVDIERALEAARAIALPHNREVLHIIPRTFTVDGQEGIRNPIGLHAYRLEVEAHIITASSSMLRNLQAAVNEADLAVDRFVLNPLASAETTLTDAERESGVVVVDIGGGTTDIAVFIEGTVWHTAVIEVGGSHVSNDVAQVLHLPFEEAERVKLDYGCSTPDTVPTDEMISVQPFGESSPTQLVSHDLARIIEARVDEIFLLTTQELKRSGYDGLLPAGVVLTGGGAALKNIRHNAARILNLPVRVAYPQNLMGLAEKLTSPAYSTAVGLLNFAYRLDTAQTGADVAGSRPTSSGLFKGGGPDIGKAIGDFLGRLLPD